MVVNFVAGVDVTPILCDGYDLGGYLTSLTDQRIALLEDTGSLGPTGAVPQMKYVGSQQFALDVAGFYDDAANGAHEALANITVPSTPRVSSRVLCYSEEGGAFGKAFTGVSGTIQSNYKRTSTKAALHKATAKFVGAAIVEEGVVTRALATISGDSNGVDSTYAGGPTASGGSGYIQCTAISLGGWTNVIGKLQHCNDGATWVDLLSFTALTAKGAQRVTVAGAVQDHIRDVWTWTGAGGARSAKVFSGFVRNLP